MTPRVRSQSFQRQRHRGDTAAGEGAAVFFKGHGAEHRQTAVLLCREDGGPRLSEVGQGLQHDQIGPGGRTGLHLLAENIHRLVEGKTAGWFQQLADRTDVQRDQTVGPLRRFPRGGDPGGDHLGRRPSGAGQLVPVGPEGIGVDHVRSRFDISAMDGGDLAGILHIKQFGRCAEGKPRFLQHGSHRAVQQHERFIQQCGKVHKIHPFFGKRSCRAENSGRIRSADRMAPRRLPRKRRLPISGGSGYRCR